MAEATAAPSSPANALQTSRAGCPSPERRKIALIMLINSANSENLAKFPIDSEKAAGKIPKMEKFLCKTVSQTLTEDWGGTHYSDLWYDACLSQLPTALDAQIMTVANAQPSMATNAGAMTATPQLLPAANAQSIASPGALRQGAWMCQNPRLPDDWRELILGWHRDHTLCTGHARHALAKIDDPAAKTPGLVLNELQKICCVQFPIMCQYEAKTYCNANGQTVFMPSDCFATTMPRRIEN